MCDSEENDTVEAVNPHQAEEFAPFRQIDYLWLFNPFTHFNERPGFVLDDANLTLDDYS